ncbi:bifunctional phosphoribosylaminoimidazolecarboxamide formyltransferase/IMP cyclohydrolase [Actinomadura sp. NPDC048955]|uniref:bifunctional phosphoribosylaminoimidazolecarboxamide formyltransferase/IMP cyclohydrolase n=1 Tax=Actinomadura TaxID=1988 RepID=UPI0021649BC3|nr:bifunctional phosphoribosylaminoimidazolecarboxamide formyltransferase/IMP cyclohydrolase [Actinomadura glauciflava]MCR3743862.1 phosphoribosylaminoimidazolecarboxamide formyltransferase / IMP cyclohydrolase [Actinomadura glauciflava]
MSRVAIERALISVYDKSGLEELARGLHEAGVEIVSTGSTAGRISAAGVPVMKVEKLTGFPECLDGRVKTLHPKVHAGLLADRRKEDHLQQLDDLAVEPFDLVVANLYPFADTVDSGAAPDECVEQIDIGGPTMVRAAAKNHASVSVVVDPSAYGTVLDAVRAGGFTLEERRRLAARAFAHTASYDVAVASWFAGDYAPDETAAETRWPDFLGATWERSNTLRYGENPHQRAALYRSPGEKGLAGAEQLYGKEMSYNNYVDTDAARRAAYDFTEPCVAIIKHANPCGIAVGADIAEAHRKAHACDPVSAYGGVIAANRPVTADLARQVTESFAEVLVAPSFEDEAVTVLKDRFKNIRLLVCPDAPAGGAEYRRVDGGVLLQEVDRVDAGGDDPSAWELKTGAAADEATLRDLAFAWRAIRSVKSNAILLAADGATVGVGMGQVNRVDSAKLAVARAGQERAAASVGASDAFFPFPDGLEVLAEAGVRAIVEPGGSVNDDKVIAAAEKAGVTLYFTGVRHFFH